MHYSFCAKERDMLLDRLYMQELRRGTMRMRVAAGERGAQLVSMQLYTDAGATSDAKIGSLAFSTALDIESKHHQLRTMCAAARDRYNGQETMWDVVRVWSGITAHHFGRTSAPYLVAQCDAVLCLLLLGWHSAAARCLERATGIVNTQKRELSSDLCGYYSWIAEVAAVPLSRFVPYRPRVVSARGTDELGGIAKMCCALRAGHIAAADHALKEAWPYLYEDDEAKRRKLFSVLCCIFYTACDVTLACLTERATLRAQLRHLIAVDVRNASSREGLQGVRDTAAQISRRVRRCDARATTMGLFVQSVLHDLWPSLCVRVDDEVRPCWSSAQRWTLLWFATTWSTTRPCFAPMCASSKSWVASFIALSIECYTPCPLSCAALFYAICDATEVRPTLHPEVGTVNLPCDFLPVLAAPKESTRGDEDALDTLVDLARGVLGTVGTLPTLLAIAAQGKHHLSLQVATSCA